MHAQNYKEVLEEGKLFHFVLKILSQDTHPHIYTPPYIPFRRVGQDLTSTLTPATNINNTIYTHTDGDSHQLIQCDNSIYSFRSFRLVSWGSPVRELLETTILASNK